MVNSGLQYIPLKNPLNSLKGGSLSDHKFSRTQFNISTHFSILFQVHITQDSMKFFVLTAVLAACAVSSLVRSRTLLSNGNHLILIFLCRVARSVPCAHRQPTIVAPAPAATIVSMIRLAHLFAVMALGLYMQFILNEIYG